MAVVLLVDDDQGTLETVGLLLRLAQHELVTADTGHAALRLAREHRPDVAFIDLRLPDIGGLEVVRMLRAAAPATACVIVTGHPLFEHAVEALRLGVADWLSKPIIGDEILHAVRRALVGRMQARFDLSTRADDEPHAMTRLAAVAATFVASAEDKPTLRLLGRQVGHAPGSIRNWCRTASVQARAFRDFCRALRAVSRRHANPTAKEWNLLEIVDNRTLRKFCMRSGGTESRLPLTVEDFLANQHLVTDSEFIGAVRAALRVHDGGGRPAAPPHHLESEHVSQGTRARVV